MPTTQLFAIVGYTNHGKSNTLYELFDRKGFFPLKSPITTNRFGHKKFTVINASNEDRLTKDYLKRLKDVLKKQQNNQTAFVITISLIFNKGKHDATAVFNFLHSLVDVDINYIVLDHSWYRSKSLSAEDMEAMKQLSDHNSIHHFSEVINESKRVFSTRTNRIADTITTLLVS